jgi:hypothetical protein
MDVSYLTFIGILLSIFLIRPHLSTLERAVLAKKLSKDIEFIVPPLFFYTLIPVTVLLYIVFLTSHYQPKRYFLPLILIWETLIPLLIFTIFPKTSLDFPKSTKDLNLRTITMVTVIFIAAMLA